MDVQAASIVVVRMMDGAKPQPPQTFKLRGFPARVRAELVMRPLSGLEMVSPSHEMLA
jgi:hypothetical protein